MYSLAHHLTILNDKDPVSHLGNGLIMSDHDQCLTVFIYTGILLVVVLAGIMTIYSLYYITMVYKVQEFGKIKALGATKRQIRQIVFREGIRL